MQPPQALGLGLVIFAEVEACGEDPKTEVGVPPQEVSHVPGTVVAGTPRGEPGDAIAPARVQVPVGDVAQEEQFHVATRLGRERRTRLLFTERIALQALTHLPPTVIFFGASTVLSLGHREVTQLPEKGQG